MEDYIKQKEDHHQQILASGGMMSQEYLCIALMAGLGSAYASLIDSLTKEEFEKPMLMKAKLRESFKTKKYLTENKSNDSVLLAKTAEENRPTSETKARRDLSRKTNVFKIMTATIHNAHSAKSPTIKNGNAKVSIQSALIAVWLDTQTTSVNNIKGDNTRSKNSIQTRMAITTIQFSQ
jgi:hypothetical protein